MGANCIGWAHERDEGGVAEGHRKYPMCFVTPAPDHTNRCFIDLNQIAPPGRAQVLWLRRWARLCGGMADGDAILGRAAGALDLAVGPPSMRPFPKRHLAS